MSLSHNLDKIDFELIFYINEVEQISIRELCNKFYLSEGTVRQRLKRLCDLEILVEITDDSTKKKTAHYFYIASGIDMKTLEQESKLVDKFQPETDILNFSDKQIIVLFVTAILIQAEVSVVRRIINLPKSSVRSSLKRFNEVGIVDWHTELKPHIYELIIDAEQVVSIILKHTFKEDFHLELEDKGFIFCEKTKRIISSESVFSPYKQLNDFRRSYTEEILLERKYQEVKNTRINSERKLIASGGESAKSLLEITKIDVQRELGTESEK